MTMPTDEQNSRQMRLHFEGTATCGHTLPASALVQALQHFQRMVHLLAMAQEGREIQQRARVTRDIERRFPVICRLAEEGGYAQPIDIGDTSNHLFDEQAVLDVAKKTRQVIDAVNTSNVSELVRIVPDHFFRRSVLAELEDMQPPPHSGVIISIEDFQNRKLLDGATAQEKIRQILAPQNAEVCLPDLGYVTGTLIEMKFNERRLSLKLLRNNKSLNANYSEDFEPVLLSHPRELIQVHGNIVFDDSGCPLSVSDVDEVLEIDESPITIFRVEKESLALKAKTPLSFSVVFDKETELYGVVGPFDIDLCDFTRPCLEDQLYETIVMLWNEYAKVDPSVLTADAQLLRRELLECIEEASHAI